MSTVSRTRRLYSSTLILRRTVKIPAIMIVRYLSSSGARAMAHRNGWKSIDGREWEDRGTIGSGNRARNKSRKSIWWRSPSRSPHECRCSWMVQRNDARVRECGNGVCAETSRRLRGCVSSVPCVFRRRGASSSAFIPDGIVESWTKRLWYNWSMLEFVECTYETIKGWLEEIVREGFFWLIVRNNEGYWKSGLVFLFFRRV